MEDDFNSGHSRRSVNRFDPKLRSLAEQKRASDPAEEDVQRCLDELRVPGRNNNRFSFCSEGEKKMCAIPRRRLSCEFSVASVQPKSTVPYMLNDKDGDCDDDDDDDYSMASIETLEGSYYSYDFIEMGLDEIEYELPIKECDTRPRSHSRPRRNYTRRRYRSSSIASDGSISHCYSRESSRTRHTR